MKLIIFVTIIAWQTTSLLATPLSAPDFHAAQIEAVCGSLGVMAYNDTTLPDYIDSDAIRKCVDHPFRLALMEDPQSQKRGILQKRVCHYDKPYGCGRGNRCFQQCGLSGSGQWCWLAANHGMGDWISCSSDSQCNSANTDCGCGVGGKDFKACGCSCSGDDSPE